MKLYDLANGLLFCFLAGSMITVSASAAVSLGRVKAIMLVSAVAWFAAAPFWMTVDG